MHTTLISRRAVRRLRSLAGVLLAIEFLDELVFSTREAAWPLIRTDLGLSYVEVGLLLAIPEIVSGLAEPLFGLYGDTRWRRHFIVGGGLAFALALVAAAASHAFLPMLLAFAVLYPASGAFVSLSQATLMDNAHDGHERAMARWAFAGSIGVVLGPLVLSGASFLAFSWRGLFAVWAAGALVLGFAFAMNRGAPRSAAAEHAAASLGESAIAALRALRRWTTWRWLLLLEFANFMMDTLLGFLALYLVDSAGFSASQAGVAIATWAGVGLLGDGLLIPLLRRVHGLAYLRINAVVMLAVYALFLLVPGFWPKVAALAVMGLLNAGWYAILKAQLYASFPGQSGAVVSISSAFGLVSSLIPITLGVLAQRFGIGAAMALLAAGPFALIVGLPRDAAIRTKRDVAAEHP